MKAQDKKRVVKLSYKTTIASIIGYLGLLILLKGSGVGLLMLGMAGVLAYFLWQDVKEDDVDG